MVKQSARERRKQKKRMILGMKKKTNTVVTRFEYVQGGVGLGRSPPALYAME